MKADHTLVQQGKQQAVTFIILTGVAMRYRYLVSGKRQIFGYLLPGDVCDAQFFLAPRIDHDIALVSDAIVAVVPTQELSTLARDFPNIRLALVRSIEADCASLREWVCNLGQRNAPQRLAHFLCELWDRLGGESEKAVHNEQCIPLSQLDMADAMGLTVAHTSRCMQQLRRANLIIWSRRALVVLDIDGLRRMAGPPN